MCTATVDPPDPSDQLDIIFIVRYLGFLGSQCMKGIFILIRGEVLAGL